MRVRIAVCGGGRFLQIDESTVPGVGQHWAPAPQVASLVAVAPWQNPKLVSKHSPWQVDGVVVRSSRQHSTLAAADRHRRLTQFRLVVSEVQWALDS